MRNVNTEDIVSRNWLTKEETEAFIGENSSFYIEKWGSHNKSVLKGWNWSALLFGATWMAYRKMYVEILFLLILPIVSVISVISIVFGSTHTVWIVLGTVSIGISRIFPVVLGMVGNTLYRKKALRAFRKTREADKLERLRLLKTMGGVSKVSVVVVTIFSIMLYTTLLVMIASRFN